MSLGLSDREARARRRFWWSVARWTIGLAVVLAAGLFAYRTGTLLAERDVAKFEEQVAALTARVEGLEQENAALKAAAAGAKEETAQWAQRYRAEVPSGEGKALYDLVKQKLADGVNRERLSFVIGAAANPRTCDGTPESKRFMVKTGIGKIKNDTASLANKKISVTAAGEAAVNEAGQKEAWYDPAKPVTVRFTEVGGKTAETSGILPIHHAFVIGDSEFRFSIAPDDKRGFVSITADRCNFP
jgi:outer membrane murein-binding lipoprotein Lpp